METLNEETGGKAMSCKFDKEIIHKYLDNTIDPLELVFLKEHIKVCSDCKDELELMGKLDESLYGFFQELPQGEIPEDFSLSVLDMCYEENKLNLRDKVKKGVEINKSIIENATRFAGYMPGSKTAAKAAKAVGRGLNKAVKSGLNYSVKKLISSTVK